ncbi:MAG TPA: hypothetical protein VF742_06230 [Terracidiphilus sp.]
MEEHVIAAQRSMERGLAWMTDHLELFVPDDPYNPENIKALAELSILFGCLTGWRSGNRSEIVAAKLGEIESVLVPFLSEPRIAEWVRKLPTYFSPYLVLYLPVRSTGIRIPSMEDALKPLRRAGYPQGLEMTPYRELEINYMCWKGGVSRKPPAWSALYRQTTLARARNPVYFSAPEVYSVTHTLFYLTDIVGPAKISISDRQRAISVVEPLLLHYWRKPDWDLTSELLLNLIALDRFETSLFCAAFRAIQENWRTDGILPGPSFADLAPDPSRRDIFDHCYHTTLVGLMLCGAYLYRVAAHTAVSAAYA